MIETLAMKKINLKAQRKELIKNRPISAREIELQKAHWDARVILGSEDLIWRSEVIDDTDSLIKSLLDLTKSCIELNIRLEDSKQLQAELSLHNDHHNIELATDNWLYFCSSLSETGLADKAKDAETKLKTYVVKHLKSRSGDEG